MYLTLVSLQNLRVKFSGTNLTPTLLITRARVSVIRAWIYSYRPNERSSKDMCQKVHAVRLGTKTVERGAGIDAHSGCAVVDVLYSAVLHRNHSSKCAPSVPTIDLKKDAHFAHRVMPSFLL